VKLFFFYTLSAKEALESQVKQLEATIASLSEENSSLVKENAALVEEKANRIAEVRQSVSFCNSWIEDVVLALQATKFCCVFCKLFHCLLRATETLVNYTLHSLVVLCIAVDWILVITDYSYLEKKNRSSYYFCLSFAIAILKYH